MWVVQRRGPGLKGIITSLAKEKLREEYVQNYLREHFFLSEGHNGLINDVEIVFVDKTYKLDPTRREEFWRTKAKILAPYCLNVEK